MNKRDFLLGFIIEDTKRKILADFTRDNNVLELDDDTFDFIWKQCGLESDKFVQELLEDKKQAVLEELGYSDFETKEILEKTADPAYLDEDGAFLDEGGDY